MIARDASRGVPLSTFLAQTFLLLGGELFSLFGSKLAVSKFGRPCYALFGIHHCVHCRDIE